MANESSDSHTVFVETNLDTHFVMMVNDQDIVADFKQKVSMGHFGCFQVIGEITVHSLKVRRKGNFYHLLNSIPIKSAFDGVKKNWFLYVDATPSRGKATLDCKKDPGNIHQNLSKDLDMGGASGSKLENRVDASENTLTFGGKNRKRKRTKTESVQPDNETEMNKKDDGSSNPLVTSAVMETEDPESKRRKKAKSRTHVNVVWLPPSDGVIKINFDGCSRGNPGNAGAGLVIRDHNAKVLGVFVKNLGVQDAIYAEWEGLTSAVELSVSNNWSNIWLETDCMEVEYCFSQAKYPWRFKARIMLAMQNLSNVKISHIHREGNFAADYAANYAAFLPRNQSLFYSKETPFVKRLEVPYFQYVRFSGRKRYKSKKSKASNAERIVSTSEAEHVESSENAIQSISNSHRPSVQDHFGAETYEGDQIFSQSEDVEVAKLESPNTRERIFHGKDCQGAGHEDPSLQLAQVVRIQGSTDAIDDKVNHNASKPSVSTSNLVKDQRMMEQVAHTENPLLSTKGKKE